MDLNNDPRIIGLKAYLSDCFGGAAIELSVVSGDASFRRYFRFVHQGHSYIGVDAPPDKEDSKPFVEISNAYGERGLSVPKVLHYDLQLGYMCLSDLGDNLLLPALNENTVEGYYRKALALLPDIAAVSKTASGDLPPYDEALLRNEMQLFNDWLLPYHLQVKLSADEQLLIDNVFSSLVDNALAQPQVGVHRDFHSRNLMILADDSVATIDYQDAVVGALTYDAVSLLRDCYIVWPDELVYRQLLGFKQLMSESIAGLTDVSDETFIRWFDLMGLQRHIKVCGIFARLYYRDGKAGYLQDIPRVMDYVIAVGEKYPEFADFVALLRQKFKPLLLAKAV